LNCHIFKSYGYSISSQSKIKIKVIYVCLLFGTKQARWVLPSLGETVSLVFNYALHVVWGAKDLEYMCI
jgi:hypothetical protein